jgi:type IV pilus assembly protein PilQ
VSGRAAARRTLGPAPRQTLGLALAAALALATALALAPAARGGDGEARVSLDLKDAPVVVVVGVLADVGGLQVVFDPGIACKLTFKVHAARWRTVLDTALSACGLGREEESGILRVAPVARLRQEAEAGRKLDEERRLAPVGRVESFRLSHARAQEMAALLQRTLPPTARATYDARTNTLILTY